MRVKVFRSHGEKIFYKINNVEDLADTNRFKTEAFKDFKTLFGVNTERKAKQIAKNMFTDLMLLIAQDMIYKGTAFIFPERGFGFMKIINSTDTSREDYQYCFETDGRFWKPKLFVFSDFSIREYVVRLNRDWRRVIFNLAKLGKLW